MKILFIGLGSIGKRHLMNTKSLLDERGIHHEIHCIKSSKKVYDEGIDKVFFSYEDIDDFYDCIFITNPTNLHYDTLRKVINIGENIFLEKPVFDDYKYDISFINKDNMDKIYVAAPLRYTQVYMKIKELLKSEKIHSVRSICSTYLPEWRKDCDYRDIYSAHKNRGGGVSIDCIHEWDYICDLVGYPEKIHNFQDKISNLEVNCEDISIYIARTNNIFIELHLDYFGKKWRREVEVITESGMIKGDFINKTVYNSIDNTMQKYDYDNNYIYEEEIKYFFDIVCNGMGNENNIYKGLKVLRLIKESEENEDFNNNLW
ncbi:Gfo/Idh/MocA family oxidoreductase [Clostridium sp. 'White wine YQ']|uniref:Gfo/Idh/MocA family oxidoreductase n=1 Tax=Clostridium sp. 'White wine YQ' TaxID=3027474 RepID=UPI0023662762|nr:Gfo/Idh/MocA family oxidoreductase [Clostridium sp. 'White wine YQ']MDD7794609.1 Gfo/Idh/MocA family oxidoreductase [Clostridium sp. 'White wine YQ']